MKALTIIVCTYLLAIQALNGQLPIPDTKQSIALESLINKYSEAREKRDTALLRTILTADVDQLVSNGEWRTGIDIAITGMLASSASNAGTRTLTVDKMRLTGPGTAIVDCKYEISNGNGTTRRMWSTFITINNGGVWKIAAIRNMLPAAQ